MAAQNYPNEALFVPNLKLLVLHESLQFGKF